MAVEPLELRAYEGERLGRGDEGGVVLHRHLLHLPPHPLRVHPQQLRLLPTAHENHPNASRDHDHRQPGGPRAAVGCGRRGAYLVEALDGEGEELGDVGLVGGAGERERGGRASVHVGGGAVARVEEVHGR